MAWSRALTNQKVYLSNINISSFSKLLLELKVKSIANKILLSSGGIIFISLAFVHLISLLNGHYWIANFTKPLLLSTLFITFYFQIRKNDERPNRPVRLILTALAFSFLGDVLLMFVTYHPFYFLLGLGSFLITHLLYIGAFMRLLKKKGEPIAPDIKVVVFVSIYLCTLLYLLYPHISFSFRVPIIVYGVVISIMLMISFSMKRIFISSNYALLVFGTVLFVLSDTLIAINKFYIEIPLGGFWIMITYILAQYFIVSSFSNYINVTNE